jgi:hypothetical protein
VGKSLLIDLLEVANSLRINQNWVHWVMNNFTCLSWHGLDESRLSMWSSSVLIQGTLSLGVRPDKTISNLDICHNWGNSSTSGPGEKGQSSQNDQLSYWQLTVEHGETQRITIHLFYNDSILMPTTWVTALWSIWQTTRHIIYLNNKITIQFSIRWVSWTKETNLKKVYIARE